MPEKIDQINKLIKALPLPKKGLYKLKDNINLDDYIAILQSKRENKTYTIDASELGGSSYIPPFLKTGGASWSGTGLVYDVTALEYYFNGDKTTSATQVTLDASDPVNNRLDAIVVDEAGVVSVIKGDASASPISPSVDESHILIQYILVEAGSTQPTIAKEDIYLENVEWTTSTYTTGTATGSIDFDNAVSPKQGVKCISANADARLGARFVRTTSFDAYQYTMLQVWVRFTGTAVARNKSLNVRFENSAGTLVGNTINLFNYGLQRNVLNTWQLVVVPITAFGALPATVKGLKVIMAGGTVGQARQWDIDLISLTDNSVPAINEQVFNVLKDGALVGQSSSLNFKGAPITVTNDPINKKIDVEVTGSGGGTPAGSDTQIQYNNAGSFGADALFTRDGNQLTNIAKAEGVQSAVTFTGTGDDDLVIQPIATYDGSYPATYKVVATGTSSQGITVEGTTGGSFAPSDTITSSSGGSATVDSVIYNSAFDFYFLNVSSVTGDFKDNDTITNGTASGQEVEDIGTYDLFDFYLNDVLTGINAFKYIQNNSLFNLGSGTHAALDQWEWGYSIAEKYSFKLTDNTEGFFGGLAGIQQVYKNGSAKAEFTIAELPFGAGIPITLITNTDGTTCTNYITMDFDHGVSISAEDISTDDVSSVIIDKGNFSITSTNNTTFLTNGIDFSSGLLKVGNLSNGNGTSITIDDVNEHITISNLPSYDDDTAAGVGGLTAGMVYMTTGSGSAPLNAAGILMIKQ